jgi:hypothetical protein
MKAQNFSVLIIAVVAMWPMSGYTQTLLYPVANAGDVTVQGGRLDNQGRRIGAAESAIVGLQTAAAEGKAHLAQLDAKLKTYCEALISATQTPAPTPAQAGAAAAAGNPVVLTAVQQCLSLANNVTVSVPMALMNTAATMSLNAGGCAGDVHYYSDGSNAAGPQGWSINCSTPRPTTAGLSRYRKSDAPDLPITGPLLASLAPMPGQSPAQAASGGAPVSAAQAAAGPTEPAGADGADGADGDGSHQPKWLFAGQGIYFSGPNGFSCAGGGGNDAKEFGMTEHVALGLSFGAGGMGCPNAGTMSYGTALVGPVATKDWFKVGVGYRFLGTATRSSIPILNHAADVSFSAQVLDRMEVSLEGFLGGGTAKRDVVGGGTSKKNGFGGGTILGFVYRY